MGVTPAGFGRAMLRVSLLAALTAGPGCSLKTGMPDGQGLSVRLQPRQSELREESLESIFNKDWMMLSSFPTSLGGLNCFGVNVRGGTTATAATCNGKIDLGVTAGFQSDVSAPFSLSNVPLSDGLVFEAFGTQGTCGDLTAGMPAGVSIFPLGSVTPASKDLAGTITIPVVFNAATSFSCPVPGQPNVLFNETFSYGATTTGLQAASLGVWQFANTDQIYNSPGKLELNLTVNQADFVAAPVEDFTFTTYAITTKVVLAGVTGTYDFQIALGLADGTQTNSNSTSCVFDFSVAAAIPTVSVAAGSAVISLYNSTGLAGATGITNTDTVALTCTITKTGANQHLVTAVANDLTSSATIGPSVVQTSDTCVGGCKHPYIAQSLSSGGGTITGSVMTGYLLFGVP